MPSVCPSIAVLDDEPRFRQALRRLLMTHGFAVQLFENGADFIAALPVRTFDCLLLDLHMPEMNGFDVLTVLTRLEKPLPVVVLTGQDEPGAAERTRGLGAAAYLTKPVDAAALLAAIRATFTPICPETLPS